MVEQKAKIAATKKRKLKEEKEKEEGVPEKVFKVINEHPSFLLHSVLIFYLFESIFLAK